MTNIFQLDQLVINLKHVSAINYIKQGSVVNQVYIVIHMIGGQTITSHCCDVDQYKRLAKAYTDFQRWMHTPASQRRKGK